MENSQEAQGRGGTVDVWIEPHGSVRQRYAIVK